MSARFLWLLVFMLPLLIGPTPGAVGACDGDDDLEGPADLEAYCDERGQMICVRRYERGELTIGQRDNCRRDAIERCERRVFLPGCRPTRRETNACLNALHSRSTLDKTIDELEECNRICTLQIESSGPRSISPDEPPDEPAPDPGIDSGMESEDTP